MTQFQLAGTRPSLPDERDRVYIPSTKFADLPRKFSLRDAVQDKEYQGRVGSCGPHGFMAAVETVCKQNGLSRDFSRKALYAMVLAFENRLNKEGGVYPRSLFKVAKNYGLVDESVVPYDSENEPTEDMPDEIYELASENRLDEYQLVHPPTEDGINNDALTTANKIKAAIFEGMPVIFSMPVSASIFQMKGPWQKQVYAPVGPGNPSAGGHLMVAYGWDDDAGPGKLETLNWWENWGDDGWGGFNYSITDIPFFEAYVIRKFEGMGVPEKPGFKLQSFNRFRVEVSYRAREEDIGKQFNFWIGGLINGQLFFKPTAGSNLLSEHSDNWVPYLGQEIRPFASGHVLERNNFLKVVNWMNLSNFTGAQLYVAASESDSIADAEVFHVVTVPRL